MVDDPYYFGQIAAANALSDVYAMGGEPKIALNLAEFPGCLEPEVLERILRGGADKICEAGASIAGGHTIVDDVPKYGLSVTGFVNPKKIWTNAGAKEGDLLILTKPLGSGVLTTAIKAGLADEEETAEAVRVMSCLNRYAAECAKEGTVHGCTDVTGFALLGHGLEMADASGVTLIIWPEKVPLLRGAYEYASMGFVPHGSYTNREHAEGAVLTGDTEEALLDILFDPQTSGGLLVSVPRDEAGDLLARLSAVLPEGSFALIGEVTKRQEYGIVLKQG